MPLSSAILTDEIRKVMDSSSYEEFPESTTEAAARWATAFDNYFAKMVTSPALPVSPAARKSATPGAQNTLQTLFQDMTGIATLTMFQTALQTYVTSVTGTMTATDPLYNWVAPTSVPPSFEAVFRAGKEQKQDVQTIAQNIANLAHNWIKLGVFQQKVTPFAVIPWATANP